MGWDRELESDRVSIERKRDLVVVGGAFVLLVGFTLRGGEVLLLEASELVKRRLDGKNCGSPTRRGAIDEPVQK